MHAVVGAVLVVGCAVGEAGDRPDPPLAAVEELRIGSPDDPVESFSFFTDMEVGPDGTIYTVHPQESAIRMHSVEGAFLGTVGRRGSGPGEFRNPGPIGTVGDTLWLLDYSTYRFTFFDLRGRLLGSRQMPVDLGTDPVHSPPRASGLLADRTIRGGSPTWSRAVARGELTHAAALRLDTSGATLDTIAVWSVVNSTWELTDPDNEGGFASYRYQPFGDHELVVISDRAPLVARVDRAAGQPDYRVTLTDLAGDTLFDARHRHALRPLDGADVDSAAAQFGASISDRIPGAPTPARATELARRTLYVPTHWPPVRSVLIGGDSTVWLQLDTPGDSAVWRVLDARGAVVGRLALPPRVQPRVVTRETMWGSAWDDLDVPYIVRYRIGPEPVVDD